MPGVLTFMNTYLGGGFKHFLFSPLLGEMTQIDFRIFSTWVGPTHQIDIVLKTNKMALFSRKVCDFHSMDFCQFFFSEHRFANPNGQMEKYTFRWFLQSFQMTTRRKVFRKVLVYQGFKENQLGKLHPQTPKWQLGDIPPPS